MINADGARGVEGYESRVYREGIALNGNAEKGERTAWVWERGCKEKRGWTRRERVNVKKRDAVAREGYGGREQFARRE